MVVESVGAKRGRFLPSMAVVRVTVWVGKFGLWDVITNDILACLCAMFRRLVDQSNRCEMRNVEDGGNGYVSQDLAGLKEGLPVE